MGRRAKGEEQSVSLFPFLSILACVIGVLTLMITALALGQMDTSSIEEATEHQESLEELEQLKEEVEIVRTSIDDAEKVKQRLSEALEELDRWKERKTDAQDDASEHLPLLAMAKTLREREAELNESLKEREEALKPLRKELAKRDAPPEPAEVMIQPSGSGTNLKPHFVEVRPEGVVILDRGERSDRVRYADLSTDETYLKFLESIATRDGHLVIFLVREDGVNTWKRASWIARQHQARNGKLAIIGQGKLDLSLFKNL